MDHNGTPDLIWRDRTTGDNTIMRMDSTARIGWAALPRVATAWTLAGTSDFDANGSPDLLFRDRITGVNTLMKMSSTFRLGWATLPTVTSIWSPTV